MVAFTHLTPSERILYHRVEGDELLQSALDELRAETGEEWLIASYWMEPVKRLFRKKIPGHFQYALFYGTKNGVEHQIINLRTPKGGSLFYSNLYTSCHIHNFILGMLAQIKTEREKRCH